MPGGPIIAQLVVWKASYDPTLSLVGYIRGYEPEQSFVLWDMKNNRELWELNKWTTRTVQPAWTQDEKRLAVVILNEKEDNWNRFELYLIDRNGNAEKWIDLKEHFKDDTVSLTWSPDSRYLVIAPVYKNQTFLVLDTLTRELLDYCIPANVGIWSPDSTQILLHQNDGSNPSIVLDIRNEQAAYFTNNKNIIPIGWLAASP
jgi:dipeptidyl aminopeptidase/acylaminoacyl peptidase